MHMPHCRLRRAISYALLVSAAAASLTTAPLAFAAGEIETVIVTGSNIRRADTDTAAPVQIVTREDIDRTGKTTLAEYLQTLTADGQGSVPKSFGTGFAPGGAGISLRGLGASSTLVLLNGRRIAPFGLADDGQKIFTDISVMPMEAVERVEVLKEGASAIYGSDAIAGVVNIILRPEYQGMATKATLATSEEGDGEMGKLSFTGGFGDLDSDRYNVYFNLEGAKTDAIKVTDRTGRDWIGKGDLRPYGYSAQGSQFLAGYRSSGGSSSPAGNVLTPAGTYESLPGCAQFSSLPQSAAEGGCIWDAAQFRYLTPEQKYVNFFAHGTFDVSESMQAYAEAGYSHKNSYFETTPSNVSGGWGYPGGPVNASSGPGAVVLGATHPDNPHGTPVRVRYSAFDVGPRTGESTNDFWRALVGLKGTLGAWDYDVGALHSESDLLFERTGFLRYSAVRTALANGTWRIGDDADLNDPSIYSTISPKIHADGASSLDSIDAKVTRSLIDLPGGELGMAAGVEYRKLKNSLTPQTFTDIGDIIGLGYSSFDGTQESSSAYVEFLAPVLPSVEVSAAARYDRYSGGLDATTPKFGVRWSPLSQVTFRGTYAEGFRVPNAAESSGATAGFTTLADPVRCPGGTARPGASAQDCGQSIAVITLPNPDLKPEESSSYTYGIVLTPFESTTLAVDAWRIKRENEINGETALDAIAAGKTLRSDNLLNGEPGTGSLLAAYTDYVNSAATTVRGIDFALRQTFDLATAGQLNLDLQWGRINSFERVEKTGAKHEYAGTHGNCDVTNCIGTPKSRINLGATWSLNTLTVGTVVNYRSSIKIVDEESQPKCSKTLADNTTPTPSNCRLKSFYSVDLTGRWQASDALEFFGTVENVTDRVAPLDARTYGAINYNPLDASGAIGRYYTVGAKYSFGNTSR
jgi:iron complex outermembrane recepter protein